MDSEFLSLERAYVEKEPGADQRLVAFHARTGFQCFKPKQRRSRDQERVLEEQVLSAFRVGGFHEDEIEADALSVKIAYTKGGSDWFHGGQIRRGYFVHVTRTERSYYPDGTVSGDKFMLGSSGYKTLVQEAVRYSSKTLDKLVVDPVKLADMKAIVIAEWQADQQAIAGRKEAA